MEKKMTISRPSICFVTAVPMSLTAFLFPHIEHLSKEYEVSVVSHFDSPSPDFRAGVKAYTIPIARKISLGQDALALWKLWRLFRKRRFDIIQSVTPKAGLLAMLAAFFTGTPIRIHWYTGQVWATKTGLGRFFFKAIDRLIAMLCTQTLADSPSQRDFLIAEKVLRPAHVSVIGDGSICGVDTQRFAPSPAARQQIRAEYGIPDAAPVILYLGRLNIDKGIRELAESFSALDTLHPDLHWLIVGPDEENMAALLRSKGECLGSRLHIVDFTACPERFMAAADIFCLPSYREGFGSVILEAAATGIPSVATRIYGLTDAVSDNETGILVLPKDIPSLVTALHSLLQSPEKTALMGQNARARAIARFSRERIVQGLADVFSRTLFASRLK